MFARSEREGSYHKDHIPVGNAPIAVLALVPVILILSHRSHDLLDRTRPAVSTSGTPISI